jgi:hypothetical protein
MDAVPFIGGSEAFTDLRCLHKLESPDPSGAMLEGPSELTYDPDDTPT